MKRLFLPAILFCAVAGAQDVNTTVHITNSYQTGVGEVSRTGLSMTIPDSLARFDYKFEYSVFDTPYQSAYEFRPYAINVTPDSSSVEDRSFWMKAGAGYPLAPELRAVWTPVRKDRFRINLRQDFHSYYGQYRTVRKTLGENPLFTTAGVRHDGYDFSENFGADLDWKIKRSSMKFSADYDGIFIKDEFIRSNSNAARASLSFATAEDAAFGFSIKLDGGFSADKWPEFSRILDDSPFRERFIGVGGDISPLVSKAFGFKLGYDFRYVDYSLNGESYPSSYYLADLSPRFLFSKGAMSLTAGLNLAYAGSGLKLSPLIDFSLSLFKRKLELYATSDGGYRENTMSSLKRENHWYTVQYNPDGMKPTHRTLDARAGLRGCISQRLQYDLNAGYSISSDKALYSFAVKNGKTLSPSLGFGQYNEFSAKALLAWRSERVDADGSFTFRKSNLSGESPFIDAPALGCNARLMYNWKRRIYGGVRFEASSDRKLKISGESMCLPRWFDLGLYGEYKFTRSLSFWLQLSNLLNQPIQRQPMHVEQGLAAMAGICLDLN